MILYELKIRNRPFITHSLKQHLHARRFCTHTGTKEIF